MKYIKTYNEGFTLFDVNRYVKLDVDAIKTSDNMMNDSDFNIKDDILML